MVLTRALLVAVLAAIVWLAPRGAAAAPGKAWSAAKASLPSATEVVLGLDLTQLARTRLFSLVLPMILAQQRDLKDGLAEIKATCGIDPLQSIESVVVGTDKDQTQGAMFLAVKDLDEAAIVGCLQALAVKNKVKDPKIAVSTTGGITELSVDKQKVYLRWIGKDVLVVPIDFDDRAQLERWGGGKQALRRAPVSKYLRKVDPRSAVWAVSAVPQELDGTKMKAGYGALATTKGHLAPDLHVVMQSASEATAVAQKANQELVALAASPGLEASLKTILQGVKVTAAGAELVIRARIPEQDLLSLAGALLTK